MKDGNDNLKSYQVRLLNIGRLTIFGGYKTQRDREGKKCKPCNPRRIVKWEDWKHLEYWRSSLESLASLFLSKVEKSRNRDRAVYPGTP